MQESGQHTRVRVRVRVIVGLGLGLLKEKQKSELRVSRRYIEVEREMALDLVSRRSV